MTAVAIAAVAGVLGAIVGGYATIRKVRPEIAALTASTEQTQASAAETITRAADGIVQLTAQRMEVMAADLREMQGRVDELESAVADLRTTESHLRQLVRLAAGYIRSLLDALTAAGIDHPAPPVGLDLTDHT